MASVVDVSTDTLRYWEREGLIGPISKSRGGYRLYGSDTVQRVRFIKQAKNCGFTLMEISSLLTLRAGDASTCRDVYRIALEKRLQLEGKIKAMKAMSKTLGHLIAGCNNGTRSLRDCPILAVLENR
jgi:DNA-binding transcriptional MerR regulator